MSGGILTRSANFLPLSPIKLDVVMKQEIEAFFEFHIRTQCNLQEPLRRVNLGKSSDDSLLEGAIIIIVSKSW